MSENRSMSEAASKDAIKADAVNDDDRAAELDARADALVAELREMRAKVAEALGRTHAPNEAKVRAA